MKRMLCLWLCLVSVGDFSAQAARAIVIERIEYGDQNNPRAEEKVESHPTPQTKAEFKEGWLRWGARWGLILDSADVAKLLVQLLSSAMQVAAQQRQQGFTNSPEETHSLLLDHLNSDRVRLTPPLYLGLVMAAYIVHFPAFAMVDQIYLRWIGHVEDALLQYWPIISLVNVRLILLALEHAIYPPVRAQ